MRPTGIVRRIDDLGRIVVPKEIRRVLRIREGDPLEIFTGKDGEVIIKKYSPLGELGTFAQQYVDSISQILGCPVCVTDRDRADHCSSRHAKERVGRQIHPQGSGGCHQ